LPFVPSHLLEDDVLDVFGADGEEVDAVGPGGRRGGLDGGNVGVDEDGFDALLLEGLDALGAGVIELAGLTNGESSRSDEEDLLVKVGVVVHGVEEVEGLDLSADGSNELVKEEGGVGGSASGLGVELGAKEGLVGVGNALVGLVVGVEEERLPVGGEGVGVDGETVVLGGDVAAGGTEIDAGLVHSAVSVLHLVGLGPGGERKELVAEADAEDGLGGLEGEGVLDGLHGGRAHAGVSGTVGKEESVPGEVRGVRLEVVVERHNGELDIVLPREIANDVVLHAAVVGDDLGLGALVVDLGGLQGDLGDEVALVRVIKFDGLEGVDLRKRAAGKGVGCVRVWVGTR
jgi:hypothetical protein